MKSNRSEALAIMRAFLTVLLFFFALNAVIAQKKAGSDNSIIVDKNFPFISFIEKSPKTLLRIEKDKVLNEISLRHKEKIQSAVNSCNDVNCYITAVQWNKDEIRSIGTALINVYNNNKDFVSVIKSLKESGYYNLYASLPDTGFIRAAWENSAVNINRILDVYVKGSRPRYFNIDAISFSPGDENFKASVLSSLKNITGEKTKSAFFQIPLEMALSSMALNERNEAARYEPLAGGMNKSPYDHIKDIKWDSYPYSIILVPGEGPAKPGINLDSLGIVRCKLAMQRYNEHLAPFIIVSGGHVHPNKTPFCEAVEMKKYMVENLNVPDNIIFIEPHARHTTTNMRNAVRMIYRFNIPADKKVLIVTDKAQNDFINMMERRFMNELKCLPYTKLVKLNDQMTEYLPDKNALQVNPEDPLDP